MSAATCQDDGANVVSTASFDVVATRRDAGAARQVILPYFDVAMQGGNAGRRQAHRPGRAELPRRQPAGANLEPGDGAHRPRLGDLAERRPGAS